MTYRKMDKEQSNADDGTVDEPAQDGDGLLNVSRRTALAGLAAAGLIGSVDTASAASGDHLGEVWSGSVGDGLIIQETTTGSTARGLVSEVDSASDFTRGVFGFAKASSGQVQGVYGKTNSSGDNAAGVVGEASASSGNTIGLLGINKSDQGDGLVGNAQSSSGNTRGLVGKASSPDGTGIFGKNSATSGTPIAIEGSVDSSDGYGLYTPDDAKVDGDLLVSGVKNFVQTVSSDAGPKQVKYTSVEAGEPQTEHSDVVEMEDGVAVVELPDHFGMVTSGDERLAVQVTPYCDEPVQPQVTDRSTDRIVVKDFSDGPDEYSFAYTVKGVRHGFEDQQVVSDSS